MLDELRGDVGSRDDALHEGAALASQLAPELDEEPLALRARGRKGRVEGGVPVEGAAIVEVRVFPGRHGAERIPVQGAPRVTSSRGATTVGCTMRAARTAPLLGALVGVLLALSAPLLAGPQAPDSAATREKLRRYLAARPFHGPVFEQLYSAAVLDGERDALHEEYLGEIQRTPTERAPRVILARLEARSGRVADALGRLAPLPDSDAEVVALRGQLELQRGDNRAAERHLVRALELARTSQAGTQVERGRAELDRRWFEAQLDALAKLRMTTGDRGGATEALLEFSALAGAAGPDAFEQHMEAAARLSALGLGAPARDLLCKALELTEGDVPRRVRALSKLIRADIDRNARGDAAARCDEVLALLAPDHWQRAELAQLRLELHRQMNTLDALAKDLALAVEARPLDAAAYLDLAACEGARMQGAACAAILQRGTAALPRSLELARAYAKALAATGAFEGAVAELQRAAALHPRVHGLHFEAGELLAAAGHPSAAEQQFAAELALRSDVPGFWLEVAAVWRQQGAPSRVESALRAAIRGAPLDLRPVRLLAEHLGSNEPFDAAEQRAHAARDSATLADLAAERAARGEERRAVALLRAALDAGGAAEPLLEQLLAFDTEPQQVRITTLRRYAELARTSEQRVDRSARYVKALRASGDSDRALRELRRKAPAVVSDDAGALQIGTMALLLAAGQAHTDAVAALAPLEAAPAYRLDALQLRIALAEARHDQEALLRHLEELAATSPRAAVDAWSTSSEILRRAGRDLEAAAVEKRLLAAAPRNPDVLLTLARRSAKSDGTVRARELYERLLLLQPDNQAARLEYARVLLLAKETDAAMDELCRLLASSDQAVRERVHQTIDFVVFGNMERALHPEVARFSILATGADAGTSLERGLLWYRLLNEGQQHQEAFAALTQLVGRHPDWELAPLFLGQSYGETTASLEHLGARAAMSVYQRSNNPPWIGAALDLLQGDATRAVRELQRELRTTPRSEFLVRRLAVAHQAAGAPTRAIDALLDWIELVRVEHPFAARGALMEALAWSHTAGLRSRSRELARALWADLETSRSRLRSYAPGHVIAEVHRRHTAESAATFQRYGLEREWVTLALGAPESDLAVTELLLGPMADHLRPGERKRALARLVYEPARAFRPEDWAELRKQAQGVALASKRDGASWASSTPR